MIVAFLLAAAHVSAVTSPPADTAVASQPAAIVFRPLSLTKATLTVRSGGSVQTIEIKSLDDALALMADKRLTAIWPEVIDWAGPGFATLRDASINAARDLVAKGPTKHADTSLGSTVRPELRAKFLLADALLNAGRIEEATRLMDDARGTAPQKGRWGAIEWASISTWLAKAQYVQGRITAAIGIIEASMPPLGNDRVRVNLELNRAAMLIDVGRAEEALSAIEAAQANFRAPGAGGLFTGYARVKGSDRQFAWLRSCALSKLGRAAEAENAAMPLNTDVEPQDKRFVIDPTVKLRLKWARCTGNVATAAQVYADALRIKSVGGDALLELQPALVQAGFDQVFLEKVRREPVLAPLLADRWRPLPDNLVPALNGWRQPPATGA